MSTWQKTFYFLNKEKKMRKNVFVVMALVLVLPALLFTVSCAKKGVKADSGITAPIGADKGLDEAERARQEAERMRAEELERARLAAAESFVNEDIYFDFDRSDIRGDAQQILSSKADYMNANAALNVTVEGHCDDRGTDAYNMALGERRAESAKAFLVNMGVAASRLSTISYGEERPADPGQNEAAWSKNRRAHFVID
jgi:peptidoglycan-associated lipoprotein